MSDESPLTLTEAFWRLYSAASWWAEYLDENDRHEEMDALDEALARGKAIREVLEMVE